tara:strand:- start:2185 stop:2409 length:225 start_codon:yes stop_codon:yes gene_type:complete
MGLKYNDQRHSSIIPSGLRSNDVDRLGRRSRDNLSKKIEQLYGPTKASIDLGIYLGTENGNILGSESGSGFSVT